ncbi:hypothetical protein BKA83DRAFT_4131069 [Pisolithus microcarpus]|nr:hypothetical protein BKA83DRAFT_4131069 [Pisolithus microcarpus]
MFSPTSANQPYSVQSHTDLYIVTDLTERYLLLQSLEGVYSSAQPTSVVWLLDSLMSVLHTILVNDCAVIDRTNTQTVQESESGQENVIVKQLWYCDDRHGDLIKNHLKIVFRCDHGLATTQCTVLYIVSKREMELCGVKLDNGDLGVWLEVSLSEKSGLFDPRGLRVAWGGSQRLVKQLEAHPKLQRSPDNHLAYISHNTSKQYSKY